MAGEWPGALPSATFHGFGDRQSHTPTPQVSAAPVPVLWLSGATAVGKSTVAYEIFTQVYRTGVRAAYVDVKQLAALRPVADDDVDSHRLNKALDRAGAGDLRVDTEGRSVEEVATEVRVRSGDWPDLFG